MKNPLNLDYLVGAMVGSAMGFTLDSWRDVVIVNVVLVVIAGALWLATRTWKRHEGRRA